MAVASPGPDFVIVLRQSLRLGKKASVYTSLGIGTGILIHIFYCVIGVGLLIKQHETLFLVFKIIASAYFLYLGLTSLISKSREMVIESAKNGNRDISFWKNYNLGLITNGINPKATIFFLSLYTVVISQNTPISHQIFYGVYMSIATAIWFSFLSLAFGSEKLRKRLVHWSKIIDKITAIVFVFLAIMIFL
ncbi:MAG: LysE family transporter [Candidatus Delongbacteria bacterium]|nr:LysE family transporter [Candidatus Delongbacteria bacterium]MBN2833688.1 LysE family transporter [Candidatus Delongbacteria bacterium]